MLVLTTSCHSFVMHFIEPLVKQHPGSHYIVKYDHLLNKENIQIHLYMYIYILMKNVSVIQTSKPAQCEKKSQNDQCGHNNARKSITRTSEMTSLH